MNQSRKWPRASQLIGRIGNPKVGTLVVNGEREGLQAYFRKVIKRTKLRVGHDENNEAEKWDKNAASFSLADVHVNVQLTQKMVRFLKS